MDDIPLHFTLDTICPWTYIAKKRLSLALNQVHASHPNIKFHTIYHPHQLHPELPKQGIDKPTWYEHTHHHSNAAHFARYKTYMTAVGAPLGIPFTFAGTIANTLDAHRLLQYTQRHYPPPVTDRLVDALYAAYFEGGRHPSSAPTLLAAAEAAGVEQGVVKALLEGNEGLVDVEEEIEQGERNGVDAVPFVVVEGRRRDVSLRGCKEVEGYVRALETVIRENS